MALNFRVDMNNRLRGHSKKRNIQGEGSTISHTFLFFEALFLRLFEEKNMVGRHE
jgi:hypothetical protein